MFSTSRSRDLGARCLRTREEAGLSAADMIQKLRVSAAQLAAFEAGACHFPDVCLVPYLTHCGLRSADIGPYLDLAHFPDTGYHIAPFTGRFPDELVALSVHESTCASAIEYAPYRIPALLQTASYARILFEAGGLDAELTDECIRHRESRHKYVRQDDEFLIGERVLRLIGDPAVRAEQLERLANARETIRIVPDAHLVRVDAPNGFRLLSYLDHGPVAIEELLVALVFVDAPVAIDRYLAAVERLDRLALSAEESRALIAEL